MKKFVLMVLAMMLMASCLIVVQAEEAIPIQSVSVIHKPPHYNGQIRQVIPRSDSIYTSDTYFTSTSECGAFLREGMKQRYETIAVNYRMAFFDIYNPEQAAAEIAAEMMAYACEHTGNPNEGDYLSWQYAYMLYLDGYAEGYVYYLTFIFAGAYTTTAEDEAQVDAAVAQLLPNLTGATDYDKVKAVYDWVTANVTCVPLTDESPLHELSAYGALINKSANSLGISSLIYRLLLELGIDNRIMYGTYNGAEQFWNIVYLDREYYNLDAALDCGNTECRYFLRCDANFDHTRDPYFNDDLFHQNYPMDDDDYVPGVLKIHGSGYCGMEENVDEVYWKFTSGDILTIYGTGRMANFNFSGCPWEEWEDEIVQVVVEEGVTCIGQNAFLHHEALTSCILPESLVTLKNNSFQHCSALTEVILPGSLKEIGDSVFMYCNNLQKVTFSEGLERIGHSAFSDCASLKEVDLPEGLIELKNSAFCRCTSLTRIRIPDTIKVLGDYLVSDCTSLTTIEFSDELEQIGMATFSNTHIESIDLPDTLTFIGSEAFAYCPLKEITIPDSVTKIDKNLFWCCEELVKVKLSDGLWELPMRTFYSCPSLQEVILPANLTSIAFSAIDKCDALAHLTIPSSITFVNNQMLGQRNTPAEVTFLGDPPVFEVEAFYGIACTVYYPGSNTKWTEDVMQNYGGTVTWVPYDDTSSIPGDLNADGTVDDGDVALLLWYTLFPDMYEISGNADFNGDGAVDDSDVAYLLWHTLFPENYPLR